MNIRHWMMCAVLLGMNSLVYAERYKYCGETYAFEIPSYFTQAMVASIQKQSENPDPKACRRSLLIKSKTGRLKINLHVSPDSGRYENITKNNFADKASNEDFLEDVNERKNRLEIKHNKKLNYTYSFIKRGMTKSACLIETLYWFDEKNNLITIQKEFTFSKKELLGVSTSLEIDPSNFDDILFVSAIEQMFLSMEIDWE